MSNRGRRVNRRVNDSLTRLTQLKRTANLTTTEGKLEFLQQLYPIIENWHGRVPVLRRLFRAEVIDELLVLDYDENEYCRRSVSFLNFLVDLGYRVNARFDRNGWPILQRTTAIHHVARLTRFCHSSGLFMIYQPRYGANYRDETGFTHFHAACKHGFHRVVAEFVCYGGVDPDEPWTETGDTPLHLAIGHERKCVCMQLLRARADPNRANQAGETPLHLACRKNDDGAWMRLLLFENQLSGGPRLRIDARSVRLAVTSLKSAALDELLQQLGFAGWNDFVFPEAREFADCFAESRGGDDRFAARLAAAALGVNTICGNHGNARGVALTILKAFDDHGLLERSARAATSSSTRHELKEATSRIERVRKLELQDLVELRPSEAMRKSVKCSQYQELAYSSKIWMLPERLWEPCSLYLCEIIMTRLCRRWALESFIRMTRHELPLVCCKKILDDMTARELYHICLAGDL
ncbi:hypothetical protein TKK_0013068 [Trichogramma kaykai]|uniref:Ankyrin repeat protein n=1 Tax=Trichogramma kaykai TaxID=54128 RepID=A0ABD2WK17_9HYME